MRRPGVDAQPEVVGVDPAVPDATRPVTPVIPPRTWRRAARATLTVLVVLGVALLLWAPALDLDQHLPFAQLTAFRLQLAGVAALAGVALSLARRGRRRIVGAVLLVVAVSPLPQVLPRALADGPTTVPVLTILSINVYLDRLDPAAVADLAVDRGADVVALPEASAPYAARVVRIAAARGVDYRAATAGPAPPAPVPGVELQGPWPTSMLVRAALNPSMRTDLLDLTQGGVTAQLPGPLPITVAAVHPLSPVPGHLPMWIADHAALARVCATGAPLVLAGDFNSTLDHSPMRGVLAAGCRDAADERGEGLRGTWPAGMPWPLRVTIDHVLLTPAAGTVAGYDVVTVAGTDHRGLVVTIGPG